MPLCCLCAVLKRETRTSLCYTCFLSLKHTTQGQQRREVCGMNNEENRMNKIKAQVESRGLFRSLVSLTEKAQNKCVLSLPFVLFFFVHSSLRCRAEGSKNPSKLRKARRWCESSMSRLECERDTVLGEECAGFWHRKLRASGLHSRSLGLTHSLWVKA